MDQVHVYGNGNGNSLGQFVSSSEVCAAFLVNWGDNASETVQFNEGSYDLPAWSVSVLPDCKNVIFNTAKASLYTQVFQPHADWKETAGRLSLSV